MVVRDEFADFNATWVLFFPSRMLFRMVPPECGDTERKITCGFHEAVDRFAAFRARNEQREVAIRIKAMHWLAAHPERSFCST